MVLTHYFSKTCQSKTRKEFNKALKLRNLDAFCDSQRYVRATTDDVAALISALNLFGLLKYELQMQDIHVFFSRQGGTQSQGIETQGLTLQFEKAIFALQDKYLISFQQGVPHALKDYISLCLVILQSKHIAIQTAKYIILYLYTYMNFITAVIAKRGSQGHRITNKDSLATLSINIGV